MLDGGIFALSGVIGLWFASVLLRDGVRPGWPTLLLLAFWVFFSYLVLPRLHRILTSIYLPAYFVGRTRTSDGLLGDPVNLGFLGRSSQVHGAMTRAGWARADALSVRSAAGIVRGVLTRRSYAGAPVSPLHLFGRPQDFAYEQEVAGTPRQRHHIRFWRCPDGWLLPGGFRSDWLAAASFDRGVGLSWFTLQFTHRVDEDTDAERDLVVSEVCRSVPGVRVAVIERFSSGYHHRNGGGDRIQTDGDLPILDLRRAPAGDAPGTVARPVLDDPSRGRAAEVPGVVWLGAGVALARSATYGLGAVLVAVERSATTLVVAVLVLAVCEGSLAVAVLLGSNWARLLLAAGCTVTALTAMTVAIVGHQRPIGIAQLLTVGGSVLVLLALSHPQARDYAVGRHAGARWATATP